MAYFWIELARWKTEKWFANWFAVTLKFICDGETTDSNGYPDDDAKAFELLEADGKYLHVCVCVGMCVCVCVCVCVDIHDYVHSKLLSLRC